MYVPSDLPTDQAVVQTLEQIDAFLQLLRAHPDRLELARTADDVERIAADGKVASMIGVEGGHSIGGSLGTLRVLAELGARYLTLTHNDDTAWADSGTGLGSNGGLAEFGEEVVRELNRLGVLVDLSHVSADTMRQAIEVSSAPVIFSHSNARALCDVPRNVPDDVIELLGRTGGVMMATFVPWFLNAEGAKANDAEWEEIRRLKEQHADDPDALRAAIEEMEKTQATPPSSVADVADHIDHIRDVAGIDHIGVGSDFDGLPAMPDGLEDVSKYPALFAELARPRLHGRGPHEDRRPERASRDARSRAGERGTSAGVGIGTGPLREVFSSNKEVELPPIKLTEGMWGPLDPRAHAAYGYSSE